MDKNVSRGKRDIDAIIRRGTYAMNNGDYAQALNFLKMAVEIVPSSKKGYYSLADFYKRLGELERASDCYTQILRYFPLDGETYRLRASSRLHMADYVNALSDVTMAMETLGKNDDLLLLRADVYSSLNLHDKAINDYNKILDTTPEYLDGILGRGYSYQCKSDFENAIEDFSRGINISPDDYIFYCYRSACYIKINEFEKALVDAQKAVEIGDFPESYYCRSLAYACLKKADKALLDIKTTLELDTENSLHLEKHFLNESAFTILHSSPRYKGLLENHFYVEIPGLADETVKLKEGEKNG
jgi:tetratricopeptide (TPR) repeat protein